ncbi:hypothetical protein RYX56_08790 [Alkalihalophilus lindianensis]|uniref:Uncharacterized protein n=1 Tax=Alkalihalophilus lindianensis TaxID=1630542 RepID=A0ABU3X9B5_9BACI|nr:hypothetical protein [Alkalihalophilus lindianensis]MDV2684465.1 hypothetical protein [Alkalihalophilus lindianensis]
MNLYDLLKLLIFVFILSACSQQDVEEKGISEVLMVDSHREEVTISKDQYDYLSKSDEVVESSSPFTQIKAFIANDEFIREESVQDEPFIYLELPKRTEYISGKIVYENSTNETMKVRSLFLQGDSNAEVKLINTSEWSSSIEYEVPSFTSISLDIEIKWDRQGMQELTFFPIDYSSYPNRYDGGNLATYRFFVHSKDLSISDAMLEGQSFDIDMQRFDEDDMNFFPIPTWLDKNEQELTYHIEDEKVFVEEEMKFVKLAAIPYNTVVDLLLVDEYGNISNIKDDINIKRNEETTIPVEELQDLNKEDKKYFLIIVNNRGEEILADLRALNLYKKPFFTTYQGVIEVYPLKE